MKTILLLISTFLMTFVASAQTKFWNHPEGGDWSDASLWSDATVPTADDDVLIIGAITITTEAVAKSVVTGDATQITISFDGSLMINRSEGAAIRMGNPSSLSIMGRLDIGNFDFVGSGIEADAGANITIDVNGTLSIQSVLTGDAINLGKDGTLTNYSALTIYNISNGRGLSGTNIVNQGTINVMAINRRDALTLVGDTLSNDNNGIINIFGIFGGSAISTDSAATITNIGGIYINEVFNSAEPAIKFSYGTRFDNINTLNISNTAGTAILMDSATLKNRGAGSILIFSTGGDGIVMDNESHLINNGNIQLGTADDPAIGGSGIIGRSGCTFENYGQVTSKKVNGIVLALESAVFDNYGIIDGSTAPDPVGGTFSMINGSRFTNHSDGFFFGGSSTGTNFYISGSGTELHNLGTLSFVGPEDIMVAESNGKIINYSTGSLDMRNTLKNGLVLRGNGEFVNNGFLGFNDITGEAIFISNALFNNYSFISIDNTPQVPQEPPAALLHVDPNGRFNNQQTGILDIITCPGDAVVFHASANIDTGFVNHGTVRFGNITGKGLYNLDDPTYPISNYGHFNSKTNGKMYLYATVINENGSEINNITDGTVRIDFPFTNKGTINNNGTWNANAAVTNNGLYKGTGTFTNSTFINNGTVAPGNSPGCTYFLNGFTNQSIGNLSIEVNGKSTACSDFDQVNVTGAATITGTLNVSFNPGYTPASDDIITILKSTSLNGTFTNSPPAGWTVLYNTPEIGDITLKKIDALPLTLLSFDVKAEGSTAKTTWKTSDEINTSHFELERSRDGISFTKLATIPAMNTGGDHQYSFTDLQPMNGRNNYRLRMVDIDGSYTNSKIVAVDMNKPASLQITSIYPNPAKDVLNLLVATNDRLTVELVAPDGRSILTKSIGSQGIHTINVSGLTPGLYFLKVSNGEVYRLMKE